MLVYINSEAVTGLKKLLVETFSDLSIVDYEMFNGSDSFGKVMIKNFKEKGVPLLSIDKFVSLDQIKNSYLKLGYTDVDICTMKDIYYNKINKEEQARVRKLEWLDEFEEIDLMQSHYFVSVAKKTENGVDSIKQVGFANLAEQMNK